MMYTLDDGHGRLHEERLLDLAGQASFLLFHSSQTLFKVSNLIARNSLTHSYPLPALVKTEAAPKK